MARRPVNILGEGKGEHSCIHVHSLYEDLRLDIVWFLASLSWTGHINLSKSVLNRV